MWYSRAPIPLRCIAPTIAARRFIRSSRLLNHPERPYWLPGSGGLCLHTMLPHPRDPKRIMVGISSAGIYRSDDGGESWTRRNKGVRMEDGPPHAPTFRPAVRT